LNEIIELIKRGFEVSIFSLNRSNEKIINEDIIKYKLMANVHFFDEYNKYNKIKNTLQKIFKRKTEPFNEYSSVLNNKILNSLNGLANHLIEQDFDYIHAGLGNRPATAAMILSDSTGIPFTFECHAYDLFVDFPFAKDKLNKARKVFTISNYNKKYLIDKFDCQPSKIIVKRVAFNKEYCDKIENLEEDNTIVSVCRLHEIKGLEYALEAIKIVSKKRKGIKYIIIGDGPQKDFLIEKIKSLEIIEDVILLGNIPNEKALEYIKRAKISLLPSVIAQNGDRDGIPTTLIESMYLQTPVITSNVSGIPELVEDGISGLLTSPKNILDIVDKINLLLNDEGLYLSIKQKSKEKIMKEFNIESNMEKMIDVFKNK
jgi:glycosyltransferase involved in cell wall biosynthesis